MRSADITPGHDYYVDRNTHDCQRVRVLSWPSGGLVRAIVVDGATGGDATAINGAAHAARTMSTRELTAPWEAMAATWNERNDALNAETAAAEALAASLDQVGAPAARIRHEGRGVVVVLHADAATRLASVLALVPAATRIVATDGAE